VTTEVWVGNVKPRCHLQIAPWHTARVLFSSRLERAGIETERLGGPQIEHAKKEFQPTVLLVPQAEDKKHS